MPVETRNEEGGRIRDEFPRRIVLLAGTETAQCGLLIFILHLPASSFQDFAMGPVGRRGVRSTITSSAD
jgi:hypothetical protein